LRSWFIDLWLRIQASYWFIPALLAVGAVIIAVFAVRADAELGAAWWEQFGWINLNTAEGARALLSAVAGSMITVAGVTFSGTLLAVSHASSQIGPRLLSGFMRDRGNQVTLGIFIATFLYCLIVLRTISPGDLGVDSKDSSLFVPHLAVLLAIGFAVLSVLVLIYFIHHVPQSINVSTVIARVGDEILTGVGNVYPLPDEADDTVGKPTCCGGDPQAVIKLEGKSGYLRVLDFDALIDKAAEQDLVIEMLVQPGEFGVPGQPLMHVYAEAAVDIETLEALADNLSWGRERTPEQDVMSSIEQMAEIFAKAMSPGVNGQFTAINCLDQLAAAFVELLRRGECPQCLADDNDVVRVVRRSHPRAYVFEITCRALRQFMRGDWVVTSRFVMLLTTLAELNSLAGSRQQILEQAALTLTEAEASDMSDAEKQALKKQGEKLTRS